VEQTLRRKQRRRPVSCLDLIQDLVGTQPGPRDAFDERPLPRSGPAVGPFAWQKERSLIPAPS
jgi:hypothetical protein